MRSLALDVTRGSPVSSSPCAAFPATTTWSRALSTATPTEDAAAATDAPANGNVVDVANAEHFQSLAMSATPVFLYCYAGKSGVVPDATNDAFFAQIQTLIASSNATHPALLARFDADAHATIAGQLRLRAMPTLLAVSAGKMLGSLAGDSHPGPVVEDFVAGVTGAANGGNGAAGGDGAGEVDLVTKVENMLAEAAQTLLRGDSAAARNTYMHVISECTEAQKTAVAAAAADPTVVDDTVDTGITLPLARATAGLARCAASEGKGGVDDARALAEHLKTEIEALSSSKFRKLRRDGAEIRPPGSVGGFVTGDVIAQHPEVSHAFTAVELAEDVARVGEATIESLTARLAVDGDDKQALYDLAVLQFSSGESEAAMKGALHLVKLDRGADEGKTLLARLFASLGKTHPLTLWGRKKLSSLLW
jgi:thioredoxin-like negative regulator of GroEL